MIAGALLGVALPIDAISVVAGVAFLGVAGWTVRGDTLNDEEASKANRSARSAVVAAAVAFFLAELGDKTMLATITLASTEGLIGTWVGSTLGMVAADGLAIVVGAHLGRRLPERAIRVGAARVVCGVRAALDFPERPVAKPTLATPGQSPAMPLSSPPPIWADALVARWIPSPRARPKS